jgi:hypothetical protein
VLHGQASLDRVGHEHYHRRPVRLADLSAERAQSATLER